MRWLRRVIGGGVGWEIVVESFWRDVRYAARTLRRSPGFASVAVLTLALGIGATTAIFSLLDAVMFKSLPVKNPEELALVGGGQYPVFQAFQQHTDIFVSLLATSGITTLDVEIHNGAPERTDVSLVSGSYFSTLGVEAAIGRVFTGDDDRTPGEHPFAVASDGILAAQVRARCRRSRSSRSHKGHADHDHRRRAAGLLR